MGLAVTRSLPCHSLPRQGQGTAQRLHQSHHSLHTGPRAGGTAWPGLLCVAAASTSSTASARYRSQSAGVCSGGVYGSVGFENFSYRAPTKCVVFGVELATPSRAWLPVAAGFSRASQGHSHIPQSPGREWGEGSEG